MLHNPTKTEILALKPVRVQRHHDNAGTYVLDANHRDIAYISNTHYSETGVWLYYSSDVSEWLGIEHTPTM